MAGLIPRSFVDDLLERVDIVEIIGQRVSLKKAGRTFKACCPFHDEKTPSFNVNPDKQFYHCFGCGAGGNVLSFLMDYESLDFPMAVESLAQHVGVDVPREENPQVQAKSRRAESLYDILLAATKFYQSALRQHKDRDRVVAYLRGRGLTGELARDFGIGFAPPGWDNLIQGLTANCKSDEEKARKLQLMEKAGLVVPKEAKPGQSSRQYYDRFRDRVMFPIRDARGRVIAFGGRVLGDEKPKYLNSPETDVFHKARELYGLFEARKRNRQLDYLLMVEGYMDVVSLFQYEINCAVATLGTASSVQHLDKIYRYTSLLVICFDGDEAGGKAARRLMELALPTLKDGREVRFLFLEAGEDPDTFVRGQGKAAFEARVERAQPLERFLFEAEADGIDLNSEAGKAVYSSRLLPYIKQLPTGIYQQRLLAKLADELGLGVDFLAQQMAAIKLPSVGQHYSPGSSSANAGSRDSASKQAQKDVGNYFDDEQASAASQTGADRADASDVDRSAGPAGETLANAASADSHSLPHKSLVWTVRALLHYPELAIECELPDALIKAQLPEAKLLCDLSAYIRLRHQDIGRVPDTHRILGHWHDTPQESLLLACIGSEHQVPETLALAREELVESLAHWSETQAEVIQQGELQKLMAKPFSSLSAEEIDLLRAFSTDQLAKKGSVPD